LATEPDLRAMLAQLFMFFLPELLPLPCGTLKYLLHAFTFVIVLAVAAATLIDIVSFIQLASGK